MGRGPSFEMRVLSPGLPSSGAQNQKSRTCPQGGTTQNTLRFRAVFGFRIKFKKAVFHANPGQFREITVIFHNVPARKTLGNRHPPRVKKTTPFIIKTNPRGNSK